MIFNGSALDCDFEDSNHFSDIVDSTGVSELIIFSEFNSKNYGRISILANWRLNIKKICDIKPNSFYPKPKVNSSVVIFEPKADAPDAEAVLSYPMAEDWYPDVLLLYPTAVEK